MATYNKDNFLAPVNQNTFLVIRDISNKQRHKIYHNTATTFLSKNKLVQIKTSSENNIISLDFSSDLEAKQALNKIRQGYIVVKTNFDNASKSEVNIEECVYTPEDGNVVDGQDQFYLPEAQKMFVVSINGVNIIDYDFDLETKILTVDVATLGYIIEASDVIEIKYFVS